LIFYRTFIKEIYKKQIAYDSYTDIIKKVKSIDIEYIKTLRTPIGKNLSEMDLLKRGLDKVLLNKNYSTIKYYAILLEEIPEVMVAMVSIPTEDFNRNKLFDLGDLSKNAPIFSTNILKLNDSNGVILFVWDERFDEDCFIIDFIKSLYSMENSHLASAILYFIFNQSENIFISPTWWDKLGEEQQNILKNLKIENLTFENSLSKYKILDGFIDWKVKNIETNLIDL